MTAETLQADTAAPSAPERRANPAVLFVLLTVAFDAMAMGVLTPSLPDLVKNLSGGSIADAAKLMGVAGTAFAMAQFLGAPVQGGISDRFGRRVVILASNFGLALAFCGISMTQSASLIVPMWAFAGFISGSMTAAGAYLADVTAPERRAQVFGMLGAAMAVGGALGPALGGALVLVAPRAPFYAAAALSLLNGVLGLIVLRDIRKPGSQGPLTFAMFTPLAGLRQLRRGNAALSLWLAAMFTFAIALAGMSAVLVLYLHANGWSASSVGLLVTVFAIARIVAQAGLVGALVRRFGERGGMMICFGFEVTAFLLLGLAPATPLVWAAAVLLGLGTIFSPLAGSAISRVVDPAQQGALQGLFRSVGAGAAMLAPAPFALVFSYAVDRGPKVLLGLPFYAGSALLLLSLAIVLAAIAKTPSTPLAAAPSDTAA